MKYMLIDNDELYTFEAVEEKAIDAAKESILNHHLYGMHIMDVKVIKDNLKLNFGEFEVDVTVTTGKLIHSRFFRTRIRLLIDW